MNPKTRYTVAIKSNGVCICGKLITPDTLQIAHKIHKGKQAENHIIKYLDRKHSKIYSRKWISDNILENPMNLVAVCSPACNDLCNLFFKPIARDELIDEIMESLWV